MRVSVAKTNVLIRQAIFKSFKKYGKLLEKNTDIILLHLNKTFSVQYSEKQQYSCKIF